MEVVKGSQQVISGSCDLFSLPDSDITTTASEIAEFFPISGYSDNTNPLQFVIQNSAGHYLELDSAELYLQVQISKQDKTALTSDSVVAPTFNFYPSLFDQVDCFINGIPVTKCSSYYGYRHHISDLLSLSPVKKNELAALQLYIPDVGEDKFDSSNSGFVTRQKKSAESKTIELCGRINESLFTQNRWLPPGIEIKLTMRRAIPEFSLDSLTEKVGSLCPYRIDFKEVRLRMRRHIVSPQVLAAHQKALASNHRYQFPTRTLDVKSFAASKDSIHITSETLISGVLPECMVFCMVETDRMLGNLKKSAFRFDHFDLRSLVVKVNGEAMLHKEIQFDINKNISLLGFKTLERAWAFSDLGNGLTLDNYINGCFAVVIDLNPMSLGNKFQNLNRGQLQIQLTFGNKLTENITCMLFCQNVELIEIDKNMHVFNDIVPVN
jgi:hypothetical protein